MLHLLMEEKKVNPNLISRIQDRRGKTIFQNKNRKCLGCDKFINIGQKNYPKIKNEMKEFLVKKLHIK